MTEGSPLLSIITLNVNGLNSPVKSQILAKWIKTHDPTIHCLQETHFQFKNKQIESERIGKDIENTNQTIARVAILISDKIGFKFFKSLHETKKEIIY